VIGIGTWNMERDDPKSAIAAIERALELGMTHVDTAEMYGNGRVEELVAQAIAGKRDRVFLVSKVLPNHAQYDATLLACESSLERLGTDHLDVYLLHWRGNVPLAETFRAFTKLREQGKIKHWGVSNFDGDDLAETIELGERPVCNQVLYHLRDRSVEHLRAQHAKHGVELVGYSPFGSRGGFPKSPALDAIARRLGATPRQVALAFLTRHAFAIPKTSSPAHVEELSKQVELDAQTIAELDREFPLPPWKGLPSI
jgi:diketogulonate reductase-like aldo/keto reductase